MLAQSFATRLAARDIHYGWVVAGISFLCILFSTSALSVPSILVKPMAAELGMSIGELSAPQGLRFVLFGLCAPFAGGLMLRYGPQRMMAVSATLVLLGLLMTTVVSSTWQLWLSMGVILGIAPGLTALQLTAVVSSRWFTARRGMIVGLLSAGTATGTLIFLPVAAWISESWGWRYALLPSILGVLLSAILFQLLAADRPQSLGLAPYGETQPQPAPPASADGFVALSFQALRLAIRHRTFWVLAFSFFICGVSSYGLTQTHFVPFCGDLGIPVVTSASLLALIGVCDLFGTIGSGWLTDRYDNRWLLAWYYGLRGLSLFWLVYSDVTLIGLGLFAIFYGLDFIATVPPSVKLTVSALGRESGPAAFGWIFAAHQLGVGLMAVAAGITRDEMGTYVPAFIAAGLLCLAAAASFILVQRPKLPLPTAALA